MGKRELVALLNLSSWCLVMVEWLFLTVPWGCLRFVIVVFPDHTHLPFWTVELASVELLEKLHRLIKAILNGSSSFLQTRRTTVTINAWMSLNFIKIPSPIMELAPLEHLKN